MNDAHTTTYSGRKMGYFRRHWNGDLSLPISYWVNCFLVASFLQVAVYPFLQRVDFTSSPTLAGGAMVLTWVLVVVLLIWQMVGTWRAAGYHRQRGGSRIWAGLARIAIVLGGLSSGSTVIAVGIPQSIEFAKIATGTDEYSTYTLTVSSDGHTLIIDGGIGFGLTDEVVSILEKNPGITTVELSSIGGRVFEARKLAQLIIQRSFNTFVAKHCFSACTVAFVAGADRRISMNAQLGFHRYSFPGLTAAEFIETEDDDRRFLQSRGIAAGFVKTVYATPAEDLWRPTHQEIFAARVAAGYAISPREEGEIRRALDQNPIYRAIREFEPETYSALLSRFFELARQGRLDDFRQVAMPMIVPLYKRHLAHASDEAVLASWSVTLEQGRLLKETDPNICYRYFREGGTDNIDMSKYLPKDYVDREFDAMALAIQTGAAAPRPIPTEAQVVGDVVKISEAVERRMGERMALAQADHLNTAEHRAAKCDMVLVYLEEMANLPGGRAPAVMRALIASRSQ
jgi:hypothetical protein